MRNELNNKGFTLVELLAVMVILVSVSFVAVGGITESLLRRDIKECKEQQKLAISAAKMYFSLDGKNVDKVTTGVKVSELISKGYIDEDDINNEYVKHNDMIKMKLDYSGYSYNDNDVGNSCG